MLFQKPKRSPTKEDADRARRIEQQRTKDAQRETEKMEQDSHPNQKPARSDPWQPPFDRHAHP